MLPIDVLVKQKEEEVKVIDEIELHREVVKSRMMKIAEDIQSRGIHHDSSKLSDDELPIYKKYQPKLKKVKYQSEEFKDILEKMGDGLKHHYENNSHHPEYYSRGVQGMDLLDILEMLVDWKSSIDKGGDISKASYVDAITTNQERFKFSDELRDILINTIEKI